MELLRGLLDTDGCANKGGHSEFANTSEQLVQDTLNLCRSLGIKTKLGIVHEEGDIHNIRGKEYIVKGCYRLYINTSKPIFKLPRKLNRLKKYS